MRKTSVYLTDGDLRALRRAARRMGRLQSDLIREGVRRVSRDGAAPGGLDEPESDLHHFELLTRTEEIAISLRNAGRTTEEIGRELGIPLAAARLVLQSIDRKLRSFAT